MHQDNGQDDYQKGIRCEQAKDYKQAQQHYQSAADKGLPNALTGLGCLALNGFGELADKTIAYRLFLQAAQKGHVRGMCNLALMLHIGDGISQDEQQALLWYEKGGDEHELWVKQLRQKFPLISWADSKAMSKEEQKDLEQLDKALTDPKPVIDLYDSLLHRLENNRLSIPARQRFFECCLRLWKGHLPSLSNCRQNQVSVTRQFQQLEDMQQKHAARKLFYCGNGSTRQYFYGYSDVPMPADHLLEQKANLQGVFYRLYPDFETGSTQAADEGLQTIYLPLLLTNPDEIRVCENYYEAQRSQQLFRGIECVGRLVRGTDDEKQLTTYLEIAQLLYHKGYYLQALLIHDDKQSAVFYLQQALGLIAHHVFTQATLPLSEKHFVKAGQLHRELTLAVVSQVRQTLLIDCWRVCYQHGDLEQIYNLSSQTTALLTGMRTLPKSAKQPLLEAWLLGFNEGKDGEANQYVIKKWQKAVASACNHTHHYPHRLDTINQWGYRLVQHLDNQDERERARALASKQKYFLQKQQPKSQQPGEPQAFYQKKQQACEQALRELEAWLEQHPCVDGEIKVLRERKAYESKSPATTLLPDLLSWRDQLAVLLKKETPVVKIYQSNMIYVQRLLADSCFWVEQQLGLAPCAFTVMGFGSYSRGEISPASDLDLAILIADSAVRRVDGDKIIYHPWFVGFLQLLQWCWVELPFRTLKVDGELKKSSVLEMDAPTLGCMKTGGWIDTPEGFIKEHLEKQDPENQHSKQDVFNFSIQWPRWIYASGKASRAKDQLFKEYQQRLHMFFYPDNACMPYRHQRIAAWSLDQRLDKTPIMFLPRSLTLPMAVFSEIVVELKALLSPLTHAILCYGRFYACPVRMTATWEILTYLSQESGLPMEYIQELGQALEHLHGWRLRQHWTWLRQSKTYSLLAENEVILWPKDPVAQEALKQLPEEFRGYYLNAQETSICHDIRTLLEVVRCSVAQMNQLAIQPSKAVILLKPKRVKDAKLSPAIRGIVPLFNPKAATVKLTLPHLSPLAPQADGKERAIRKQQDVLPTDKKAEAVELSSRLEAQCRIQIKKDPEKVSIGPVKELTFFSNSYVRLQEESASEAADDKDRKKSASQAPATVPASPPPASAVPQR